jgi:antitoxin component of MazEF toxin-antitoxin module
MNKVFKKDSALAINIPEHIAKALNINEDDNIDFELLNNDMAGFKKRGIKQQELNVLRKLSTIKFADRTKEQARALLSTDEQKTLGSLMKQKAISFYEEGKYKNHGVYSISRDYYALLSESKTETKPTNPFNNKGYAIIKTQQEAESLLSELKDEIKKGSVVVVRGFDKEFYFTTNNIMNNEGSKIIACLEGANLTAQEIAKKCSLEKELTKTVIEILRESGDIIEWKRGIYKLA